MIAAIMDRNRSRAPLGPVGSANPTTVGQPNGSAEERGLGAPNPIAAAATEEMNKSTSNGSSSWRQRLPKYGFAMLPNAHPEPRPFVNNYFFKRPRLLQYYEGGAFVDSRGRRMGSTSAEDFVLSSTTSTSFRTGGGGGDDNTPTPSVQNQLVDDSSDPETSKIQRDWLNLFIDLLWVGIVSNISATFVEGAFDPTSTWGAAFLQFIVLFLTAFRFWSYIRKFLNNFFRKDFVQSIFLIWVLVLALFFGNQTPYFLDHDGRKWVIGTFLIAKASFIGLESVYCIFIPSLRREFFLTALISVPVTVLWSCSLLVDWPTQAALILPAVLLEGAVSAVISLPLGEWFLRGAPRKALDPENFVDRLQGFFIIVLGEGVYGLISGNNWGVGTNGKVVLAIESLIIYYSVFWLFFTGDQTKTYIHAIYRNRYTSLAFQLLHVLLFASILLLDASVKYLIANTNTETGGPENLDNENGLVLARWTICSSLDATLLWMTLKAFLNRSLDGPGTLRIDNRYLRMAPRFIVMIVVMCLPAVSHIDPYTFLSVILAMIQTLMLWEVLASMEKGAKWFEPKESGANE